VNYTPTENPITNSNWRRHQRGCPHYRERWFPQSDLAHGEPMYQVFCGMNTPPGSIEEQEKCLSSRTRCWRLAESVAGTHTGSATHIPISNIKRRRPA